MSNGYGVAVSNADADTQAYAWNWFALHSSQRMQLVNFWLVAIAFLGAAFVQARTSNLMPVAVGVCVAGATASIAFMLLDARTRSLVRVAEQALAHMENARTAAGAPDVTRLVQHAHTARSSRVSSYRIVIQGLQLIVALAVHSRRDLLDAFLIVASESPTLS